MGNLVLEEKWPVLGRHEYAARWLRMWADLGRSPRTIDAYGLGLAGYLEVCERALLGQAIAAWEAVRPTQPAVLDRKTSERVHLLFSYRAQGIGRRYVNNRIIPALCAKAGVPTADVRGKITSHRARSTIASQLYNAKEPMTLFELQAWLGHGSPNTTQHYAKITPTTLTKAYRDAGYFERNLRTIEVLVDRDAVTSGAAAAGKPWQHYDLGHGWCTYTFFEQCPHRMACARCDFYLPKNSAKAQALEAKHNLQRMLASIPLTDDEQAAVHEGQAALDQLLGRLADIPTPAGQRPGGSARRPRRPRPCCPSSKSTNVILHSRAWLAHDRRARSGVAPGSARTTLARVWSRTLVTARPVRAAMLDPVSQLSRSLHGRSHGERPRRMARPIRMAPPPSRDPQQHPRARQAGEAPP